MRPTAILVIPFLAGLLQGQGDGRFDQARLVERDERNPRAAAKLYEAIAKDPAAAPELRARAWLRLGLCLGRIGRAAAAKAALEKAAAGQGAAAAEARNRLQGKPVEDQKRLAARVRKLIAMLRGGVGTNDLLWIGDPTVPYLVQAIETEKLDLDFVRRAVALLLRLGGPKVAGFLDRVAGSEDRLLRRTVASGFTASAKDDLRPTLIRFLDDRDPRVRAEAILHIGQLAPVPVLLGLAEDPSVEVRRFALMHLANAWFSDGHPDPAAQLDRLVVVLRKAMFDAEPGVRKAAVGFWARWPRKRLLLSSEDGTRLFLDFVGEKNAGLGKVWSSPPADRVASAEAVLAVARRLGALDRRGGWSDGQRELYDYATRECLPRWRSPQSPGVLGLVDLGYAAFDLAWWTWVRDHVRAADLGRVVALIRRFAAPLRAVDWLRHEGRAERYVPALRARIDALLASGTKEKKDRDLLVGLCAAVGAVHRKDAAGYLVGVVRQQPAVWKAAATALMDWPAKDAKPFLRDLIALPAGRSPSAPSLRNRIFRRLVGASVRGAAAGFAAAYDLGLGPRGSRSLRGLEWILVPQGDVPAYIHSYGPDEIRDILDACLGTGRQDAWEDVSRPLLRTVGLRIPDAALEVVAARVESCPNEGYKRTIMARLLGGRPAMVPGARTLAARLLRSTQRSMRLLALRTMRAENFPDFVSWITPFVDDASADVQRAAIAQLAGIGDASVAGTIARKLAGKDSAVRAAAVTALSQLEKERALDRILPLLEDPASSVRLAVIRACRQLLARKAVPALIGSLRDPQESVRKAATDALQAIRFYEETRSHWDRWLRNAGAASAAEALVQQAGEDQPKKVRIAAIRSLGTLGDPEALPFLIERMKDGDPEIAAAAAAAVDRLNRSPGAQGHR